nr:MAG TPA: hypothetical protein [Caudoviricetes sp.]DAT63733.1 MAG TPA: hypothetical protein [Caudoviricetes sp.]
MANTKIKKNETKDILKSHKKRFIMVAWFSCMRGDRSLACPF